MKEILLSNPFEVKHMNDYLMMKNQSFEFDFYDNIELNFFEIIMDGVKPVKLLEEFLHY